jgi:hypothetical protein
VGETPRPDFGSVVARYRVRRGELIRPVWILLMAALTGLMIWAPFVADPRRGPPQPVFYVLWAAFAVAAARMLTSRLFSTPTVLLERGIFLPAFRPRHFLRIRGRAFTFDEIKRVRLDETNYRSGSHVFETVRGPIRVPKAYLPPIKRFAEELRRLAPAVEVIFEDSRGKRRRYTQVVTRKRRPKTPRGESPHAK